MVSAFITFLKLAMNIGMDPMQHFDVSTIVLGLILPSRMSYKPEPNAGYIKQSKIVVGLQSQKNCQVKMVKGQLPVELGGIRKYHRVRPGEKFLSTRVF